jgi:hypothetical protein
MARDKGAKNPNPVIVSDGVAARTSKQDTELMLCEACEHRFGRAENYVARVLRADDDASTPPFMSMLGAVRATKQRVRLADPGKLDTELLVYFGLSVIWRASVSTEIDQCHLGPYEEQFRAFLLGESSFPANAACVLLFHDLPLPNGQNVRRMCTTPVTERHGRYHSTRFPIFGPQYWVAVGKEIPAWSRRYCLAQGERPILLMPQMDLIKHFGNALTNVRLVGSLAKVATPKA